MPGRYRDVVPVLALAGLRWGELAGLQVTWCRFPALARS
jgi:hypothetical protein